eukprot:132412_1
MDFSDPTNKGGKIVASWKTDVNVRANAGTCSIRCGPITKCKVVKGGFIFKYRVSLYFSEYKGGSYSCHITDQDGDRYELSVMTRGWHYIDYNSPKPTIKKIEVDHYMKEFTFDTKIMV